MRYQRVEWRHDFPDEPVVLYAELDDDGWEQRKVDEFRDGRLAWADARRHDPDSGTSLSIESTPTLGSINAQAEFAGAEISKSDFESVWARAIASSSTHDIRER